MGKQRFTKKTLFIACEGSDEKVFVDHLKSLYSQGNTKPTVGDAQGGCPYDVVLFCVKRTISGGFHKKIVMMDMDSEWDESSLALINKHGIIPLGSDPCLEILFLQILEQKPPIFSKKEAKKCKKKFQDKYLAKRHSIQEKDCKRLFTKELLDRCRLRIPILNDLISLLAGKDKT